MDVCIIVKININDIYYVFSDIITTYIQVTISVSIFIQLYQCLNSLQQKSDLQINNHLSVLFIFT